jgi:hypothetical protein
MLFGARALAFLLEANTWLRGVEVLHILTIFIPYRGMGRQTFTTWARGRIKETIKLPRLLIIIFPFAGIPRIMMERWV